MEIRGSQAGCQVTCVCGKESRVPPLSELKVHQDRNEATPVIGLVDDWATGRLASIEHLTRAIVLTNNHPDIRLHRGVAYLSQNKFALAIEDCQQVLSLEPNNAQA